MSDPITQIGTTKRTLFQVHWQNRSDYTQTEFVAQCGFDDLDQVLPWANEVIERRIKEMPEGWCPLVVMEGGPPFVYAVSPESPA